MLHWIRDCAVSNNGGTGNGSKGESNYLIYHFLRVGGWEQIWECDGEDDNHFVDGSMEADALTAGWTQLGGLTGTVKTTNEKHMGNQSMSYQPTGPGENLRSAGLTTLQESTDYQISIWAKAEEIGEDFDVIFDENGVPTTLGTVNGLAASGWRRFDYSFSTGAGVVPRFVRFDRVDAGGPVGPFFIDSCFIYESWFEYNGVDQDYIGTTDGDFVAPDLFDSTAYTFVAGDIGKYIATWDGVNVGNSGVYKIIAIDTGRAQLDLRAGGSPAMTPSNGLPWRLLDVTAAPRVADSVPDTERLAGYMLESPHSESWRMCLRNNFAASADQTFLVMTCCPYDGDFDVESGHFYDYEASTQDVFGKYGKGLNGNASDTFDPANNKGLFLRGYGANNPGSGSRVYLMTDDDGSFVNILLRGGAAQTDEDITSWGLAGFTGADAYHTLRESFAQFGVAYASSALDDMDFKTSQHYTSTPYCGCQVGTVGVGWMNEAQMMVLGVGATSVSEKGYSNPRPNPFDGNDWLRRVKICRDYTGGATNSPSEKVITGWGLRAGTRKNDTTEMFSDVDSGEYLYMRMGVYFKMPGQFTPLT